MKRLIRSVNRINNNEYAYSVITKVFGVLAGLVYSILYSRYLGKELRGEAAVVVNFSTLTSLVLCAGIYQAYPFFRKNGNKDRRVLYEEYINNCLGLFLLYIVLCIFISLVLPLSIGKRISFILIPFLVGTRLFNYVVLIETPKKRNTASIVLYLFDIFLVVGLMLFTKADLFWCFFLLVVKEIVYFLVAIRIVGIPILKIRPTIKNLVPYIRFGIIPMMTIILMEINYRVDVLMLEGKVSSAEIGVYSLGVQLAERLWLIPDALKDILLSKLTKGKAADEVAKITRISLAAMIVCVFFAVVLGRPFLVILFGKEYSGAYEIMLVILASVISMVFYKMVYAYNVANGNRGVNLIILGLAATLNVVMNFVLIPQMGNMGAAVASLVSYSVCGLAFLIYFISKTHTPLIKMVLVTKSDFHQMIGLVKRNNK